jgi:hypothetical protein
MSTERIPEGATFVTTSAIEVEIARQLPRIQLDPTTRLRHLRSLGWWSGNIEFSDYFFEVEDGPFAGTEVCINSAQVNGPPEDLTGLAARCGLVLVSEPDSAAGSRDIHRR